MTPKKPTPGQTPGRGSPRKTRVAGPASTRPVKRKEPATDRESARPAKRRKPESQPDAAGAARGGRQRTPKKPVKRGSAKARVTLSAGGMSTAVPDDLGIYEVHVTFNSRWIEALVAFFRDKLGFEERRSAGGTWGGEGVESAGTPAESLCLLPDLEYLVVGTHAGGSLGFMDWRFAARIAEQQGAPAPPAPGVAGLYFLCRDLERVYRELSGRGVIFDGPPAPAPWGHRIVRTVDPEGRALIFAETETTPAREPASPA